MNANLNILMKDGQQTDEQIIIELQRQNGQLRKVFEELLDLAIHRDSHDRWNEKAGIKQEPKS